MWKSYIVHTVKIFLTQDIFGPRYFRPKIFLAQDIFGPRYFWPKIFLAQDILGQDILGKRYFRSKIFWVNGISQDILGQDILGQDIFSRHRMYHVFLFPGRSWQVKIGTRSCTPPLIPKVVGKMEAWFIVFTLWC